MLSTCRKLISASKTLDIGHEHYKLCLCIGHAYQPHILMYTCSAMCMLELSAILTVVAYSERILIKYVLYYYLSTQLLLLQIVCIIIKSTLPPLYNNKH